MNIATKYSIEKTYLDEVPFLNNRLKVFCTQLKLDVWGSGAENWLNEIECQRRDGFIPHSHNRGGFDVYNTLETNPGEDESGDDDSIIFHGFRFMYEGQKNGVHVLCAYYSQWDSEDCYGINRAKILAEIEIRFRKPEQLIRKLTKFTKEYCK